MRRKKIGKVNPSRQVEQLEERQLLTTAIYADALASGWQNWSWDTSVDLAQNQIVRDGSSAIRVDYQTGWAGLYLVMPNGQLETSADDTLTFSIRGGTSTGRNVKVFVVNETDDWIEAGLFQPTANMWSEVAIPMSSINRPSGITGLVFQEFNGGDQDAFYLDNVILQTSAMPTDPVEPGVGPTITIEPDNFTREINDDIYGLNFADESFAADLDLTVDRWGGNATTRYNYLIDASNRASDFFFENHPEDRENPSAPLPDSSSLNDFIRKDQQVGADSVVTVNTIGWVTKGRDIVGGFEIDKYGPQQEKNPWRENGNGIRPDGTPITGNDPNDTSIPVDETFTEELVEYFVSQYGTAAEGGVQFYALDNEPMLWTHTHRDVHPEPTSYDEVLETGIATSQAIKRADPTADVLGPVVWGWTGYFYSQLDIAGGGAFWENPQDRNAHGGVPFLPWYLSEMAEAEAETGERLLDYLDIHYYPQQAGVTLTQGSGSLATQTARMESTRSLWDPTYRDPTWIDNEVQLIPRMRDWIDENYPGTKLAITEYNFGATNHINGAVAQADVLGILGREGVDLATMWAPPSSNDPAAYAFRMYRNYDGQGGSGSRFGESGVLANSGDQNQVAVYAAQRDSDDALTVMLVNKSFDELTTPIELPEDYDGLEAEVYTYDASNLDRILRGDVSLDFTGSGLYETTLPAQSITLLEIPSPDFVGSEVSSMPVNVVTSERIGSPVELLGITLQFDGDASSELALELTRNGDAIDLSSVVATWDVNSQLATWDLESLDLPVGRYVASWQAEGSERFEQDLLVTYPGDGNLDGKVGFGDFTAFAAGFGKPNPTWEDGDFNGDGETTFQDFLGLAQNFGANVDEVFAQG